MLPKKFRCFLQKSLSLQETHKFLKSCSIMIDTFKHRGLRQQLANGVQQKGIKDKRILEAIATIPRHFFVENFLQGSAYQDRALPIPAGQTISQPYTVAFQTELLRLSKGEKVLEIGTGSGYQTAVLLELGVKVYTIERQRELYAKTQSLLEKLGYNPHCFYGDGYLGKPTYGPFDKILITAGAPAVPEELLRQLKIGGIMVAPIGGNDGQIMLSVQRISETRFEQTTHGNFIFVPMLKGVEK